MRKLLVLLSAAFLVAACAQSVTTGADDSPINAAQPNDPQQDSGVSTTPSTQNQKDSGTSAQNDSGSQPPKDSGAPPLDAMPDVGPPPADASTGGGGICNLNDPLYAGKAIIEINKSSPRQCANGCKSNECCFWVYQVCVDL
jgi:hypothetical protein